MDQRTRSVRVVPVVLPLFSGPPLRRRRPPDRPLEGCVLGQRPISQSGVCMHVHVVCANRSVLLSEHVNSLRIACSLGRHLASLSCPPPSAHRQMCERREKLRRPVCQPCHPAIATALGLRSHTRGRQQASSHCTSKPCMTRCLGCLPMCPSAFRRTLGERRRTLICVTPTACPRPLCACVCSYGNACVSCPCWWDRCLPRSSAGTPEKKGSQSSALPRAHPSIWPRPACPRSSSASLSVCEQQLLPHLHLCLSS
jgi:hypothetical protein